MGHVLRSDDIDLSPYRFPIAGMPPAARAVHAAGLRLQTFPAIEHARSVLLTDHAAHPDGIYRAPDGTALLLCTTRLLGVTPAMVDWWFGWHLPESARYQLWHPRAHLKARCKDDRSSLADDRARYVGNVSYVDEYIGAALTRLAIEFQQPASFGFAELDAMGATAICARTVDRLLRSEGGSLTHLVVPTEQGAEMRSGFWLGQIDNRIPAVGSWVSQLVNRSSVRRLVIKDRFLLDLFQHCSEEMNHLAKFLPRLYADVHRAADARTAL